MSLLFISRIFTTVIYFSLERQSIPTVMVTAAVSVAADMLLVIPALLLHKKFPSLSVVTAAFKVSRPLGWGAAGVYSAATALIVFKTMRYFLFFFENTFSELLPLAVVAALIMAAAIYISTLGFRAAARTSAVVLGLFFVMLILCIGLTAGDFDFTRFYFEPIDGDSFFSSVMSGISRSSELVVLPLCIFRVKSKAAASAYGFLALKLVVIEAVLLSCLVLLGSFSETVLFPFFTLCSYATSSVIERLDAVFLVVWTLMGIVRLSFAVNSMEENLTEMFGLRARLARIIILVLIGGLPAVYCAYKDEMIFSFLDRSFAAAAIIAAGFVIPALAAAALYLKKRRETT